MMMDWLILIWIAFVVSVLLAGWMLLRSGREPARPLTLAEELVANKMANEKYRSRLSPKQRAGLAEFRARKT